MTSNMHGRNFVGSHLLLRLTLTGLILIVLLASSVGQARSASKQQITVKYELRVYSRDLLDKFFDVCVGDMIKFEVWVDAYYLRGKEVYARLKGPLNATTPVLADVIGQRGLMEEKQSNIQLHNDGKILHAKFTYRALEKGHEKILFQTIVPSVLPRVPSSPIKKSIEFDVKECKYGVNLIYRSQQLGQTLDRTGWWMEYGNMEEVFFEPDEQGNFEVVGLYQFGGYLTNMAECPWNFTGSDLQVDIAGNLGEDVVNLALDFGWPEVTVSFCAGSYTSPPAALLGQQNGAIPTAGGVTNIIVPVTSGTAVITVIVQPEAEEAVSRMDNPVAWLPGWFEDALFLPK